jgi:hypothetical protein
LRQGDRQSLELGVILRFFGADFLAAGVAEQLIDIPRAQIEGLEDLQCVLMDSAEIAIETIAGVQKMIAIRNPSADGEEHEGQNERQRHKQFERTHRSLRALIW